MRWSLEWVISSLEKEAAVEQNTLSNEHKIPMVEFDQGAIIPVNDKPPGGDGNHHLPGEKGGDRFIAKQNKQAVFTLVELFRQPHAAKVMKPRLLRNSAQTAFWGKEFDELHGMLPHLSRLTQPSHKIQLKRKN